MQPMTVIRGKYGFAMLRALADGPLTFSELHMTIGCVGRMVSATAKACIEAGLVVKLAQFVGKRGGYQLTLVGRECLGLCERIVALGGEPSDPFAGTYSNLLSETPAPVRERIERARAALVADERIIDTSEFARNEPEDAADYDAFGGDK